ncbi:phosphocarrier protein HPr [Borreliella lusitaniae]|uniref:Phosphocarrier protein HPr n=1 Tax=Borreliella lusitaniae TaxID=100177 RepID=A0ABZ0CND6_9SPIR|nr:phosphocarrier protein HPr [Borreliella lusitaniae]WNY68649.1 phosphocarrier protein HPr [Borreliella lusitaniae]
MQEVKFKIINKEGIHSKPENIIAKFTNKHSSCDTKITTKDGRKTTKKFKIEIIRLAIVYKKKVIAAIKKKELWVIKNLLNLLKYNFSKELEK